MRERRAEIEVIESGSERYMGSYLRRAVKTFARFCVTGTMARVTRNLHKVGDGTDERFTDGTDTQVKDTLDSGGDEQAFGSTTSGMGGGLGFCDTAATESLRGRAHEGTRTGAWRNGRPLERADQISGRSPARRYAKGISPGRRSGTLQTEIHTEYRRTNKVQTDAHTE